MKMRRLFVVAFIVSIMMFVTSCLAGNYKVAFDTDGGSSVSAQYVALNDSAVEPAEPTKEGYEFAGWYLNDELYDFSSPVDRNFVLVAKWEEKVVEYVKVTFVSNGEVFKEVTVEKGQPVGFYSAPEVEGKCCVGWFNDEVEYDFNAPVESDIELVAKYEDELTIEMVRGTWKGAETMSGMEVASFKFNFDDVNGSSAVCTSYGYELPMEVKNLYFENNRLVVEYNNGTDGLVRFKYVDGQLVSESGIMGGSYSTITLSPSTIELSEVVGTWEGSENYSGMEIPYTVVIKEDGSVEASIDMFGYVTPLTLVSLEKILVLDYMGMQLEFQFDGTSFVGTGAMGAEVVLNKKVVSESVTVESLKGTWVGTEVTSYGDYSYEITLNADGTGSGKYVDAAGMYPSDMVISKTEVDGNKVVMTYVSYGMDYTIEFTYADGVLTSSQGAMWGTLTLNKTISLADVAGKWVASESFYGMEFSYEYVINADGTGSASYTSSAMTTVMTVISYAVKDGKIVLTYQVDGFDYDPLVFTYENGELSGTTPMGTTVTYTKSLSASDFAGEWVGTEVTSYGDYSYEITLNADGTGSGKYVDAAGMYPSDMVISKVEVNGNQVVVTYQSYGMDYTIEFTYADGVLTSSQGAMWGTLTLNRK